MNKEQAASPIATDSILFNFSCFKQIDQKMDGGQILKRAFHFLKIKKSVFLIRYKHYCFLFTLVEKLVSTDFINKNLLKRWK